MNVWQADSNALENFETYRLLDFDYPQQVQQFIDNWFEKDIEKGKLLKAELHQPERGSLQNMVKNPLRLSLLCSIWQEEEGNLPKTKAGLYGQYRKFFYAWKREQFHLTQGEQNELDSALAKLALRDINEGSSRFRMRKSFVVKELGYAHFDQAIKIGWLNHVGYAAESASREEVYAFYHATFEEYFAALAVESWNWNYFLDYDPEEPETGTYRIFEPQWREVILLWLGREDIGDEPKNRFIQSLINFTSGCGNFYFYEYQAYFLAAVGIAEFGNCQYAEKIVEQVVRWGYYIEEGDFARGQEAGEALLQTERELAIAFLSKVLADNTLDGFTRIPVALDLGNIDPGNTEAIAFLSNLLADNTLDGFTRRRVALALGKIDPGNTEAIAFLSNLLADNTLDNETRIPVALSLGKIGNSKAIAFLSKVLADNTLDGFTRWQVALSLGKIGNSKAIVLLSNLLADNTLDNETRMQVAEFLGKIDPGNTEAIAFLSNLLADNTLDNNTRIPVALSLGKIDPGNTEAIAFLSNLLADNTLDNNTRIPVAEFLGKIDPGNREAIQSLSDQLFDNTLDNIMRGSAALSLGKILTVDRMPIVVAKSKNYSEVYGLIWQCAEVLPYPEFYRAWHGKL